MKEIPESEKGQNLTNSGNVTKEKTQNAEKSLSQAGAPMIFEGQMQSVRSSKAVILDV